MWNKIKEWFKNNYQKIILGFMFVVLSVMTFCLVGLTIQMFIDVGIIWKVLLSYGLQIIAARGAEHIFKRLIK